MIDEPRLFRLGRWRIEETAPELERLLSRRELYAARVARLHPDSRRMREVLAVQCLVAHMVGEECPIAYDPEGRPSLPSGMGRISISHTEGWAAVLLLSPSTERFAWHPGVDVERIGHRVARVAERFLRPEEMRILDNVESALLAQSRRESGERDILPAADPLSLHLAWSAKETAFKILGSDFYDLQNKVTIAGVDAVRCRIRLQVEGRAPLVVRYRITPDHVLTYAIGRE